MLADMRTECFAAQCMVEETARRFDEGKTIATEAACCKMFASEMVGRVADKAVQIFGGMGYCREMPLEQLYRDSRVYRIFDGASDIHRVVIARSLLKSGRPVL
jgi:acyl-CoA dehydrogenase